MCVCNVNNNNLFECFRNYRMRSVRCWSLGSSSWTRSRTCVRSRCPARSRAPGRRAWAPGRAAGSPEYGFAGSWARHRRPDGSPAVAAVDWRRWSRPLHPGAGATVTGRDLRAVSRPLRPWAPCRTVGSARRARTVVRPARGPR